MENNDNIIVLIDEFGEEVKFEYLDTIEYEDSEYVVLTPAVEDEAAEDDELRIDILKIEHVDDEDSFVVEEDEEKLEAVFEIFRQRFDEETDEE
jgi:uncharacterized protein YrzB (UPF0473 family)